MNSAPLVIFAYNRPLHLKQVVEAVASNDLADQTNVIFFCDGARNEKDEIKVAEVKNYLESIKDSKIFKSIAINYSSINKGLARSIIEGVSAIVSEFGRIIVLEDDLVPAKYFLTYMNEALDLYESDVEVASIHAYIYPIKKALPKTFFIRGADCWGWATWKRGWDLFEKDGSKLLCELEEKNLTKKFDFDGCYPYTQMLRDQISGKNNSWAIRWYASAFLKNKFTLYPYKSFVKNIGNDGSGTHCADIDDFDSAINNEKIILKKIAVKQEEKAYNLMKEALKPQRNLWQKIIHKLQKKLKKRQKKKEKYGWFFTDLNWHEAKSACSGYDDAKILEKCKNALLRVKNNEAVFERDSVLFDKIEYSWPVLSGLLLSASLNSGKLEIIDFGGSLGSCYFQNRKFLNLLPEVKWNIVEQKNFVECGKRYFEDEKLKFYYDIDSCLKENSVNAILLSSVIQYLEEPYKMLDEIISKKFEFIIFDLTGFYNQDKDVLTIQKVWPEVYEASYPCWFFSKTKFFAKILEKYDLIEEFESHFGADISIDGRVEAKYLGAIFKIKKDA